jgi:hypothetical protein
MAKQKQNQALSAPLLTPKAFYAKYSLGRVEHENTAIRICNVTLPYIMMPQGASSSTQMQDSIAQAFCGRAVNSLKAKMGMSLLPPSTSSFRLAPDKDALAQITNSDANKQAEVYQKLSGVTAQINNEIEAQQIRDKMFDLLAQLIVIGSVVIEKKPQRGIHLHFLRSFTVDLNARGEPRGICVVEKLKDLPKGIEAKVVQETYNLYTLVTWDNITQKWTMTQSIEDDIVGESQQFTDEECPFKYVGWTWTEGDKYHRPYAEDYLPDMEQYNTLATLVTKGSVVASKVLIFVDEKGNRTRKSAVANSANGDVVNGRAEDVTAFQLNKNFDFQVPVGRMEEIKKDLSAAFLMNESVTRNAERVTAEEIRYMAQELESSSLSGVYSKLSVLVSKQIVLWIMAELKIKFDAINVNVITGLDALGRSQESQKLDGFMQRMTSLNLVHWVKEEEVVQRYAAYDGIDVTNLIKTPDEVKSELAQQQQQQTAQAGTQALAESAGKTAGANIVPQG